MDETEALTNLTRRDSQPLDARDRAMVELLYGAGVRVAELCKLSLNDVDLEARTVRVTDCGVGGGCTGVTDSGLRLVTVAVRYTPMSSANKAVTAKSVQMQMVVSQR